jgi:hypothetical protein
MASYNGSFTVVNCTGNTITGVTVTHACGSYTNNASSNQLSPGQSVTQTLNSQSGSNDIWNITFTMNGKTYSRQGKQCNYETEDAPQTCVIALYSANWSSLMPVSSSCEHNYYSTPAEVAGDISTESQKADKRAA